MRRNQPIYALLAAAVTLLCSAGRALGAADEYKVKAAFVYNFVQFVEWPAAAFGNDPKAPIVIGVLGTDPFGGSLEKAMAGHEVNGRSIVVRHFPTGTDVSPCHVLFCAPGSQDELRAAIERTGGSCLIIGESREALIVGGVIQFYSEDNKLRFEINVKAAERQRLKISAKLLKLARIYGD